MLAWHRHSDLQHCAKMLSAGIGKAPSFKMEKFDDPEPLLAELRTLGFQDVQARCTHVHCMPLWCHGHATEP